MAAHNILEFFLDHELSIIRSLYYEDAPRIVSTLEVRCMCTVCSLFCLQASQLPAQARCLSRVASSAVVSRVQLPAVTAYLGVIPDTP